MTRLLKSLTTGGGGILVFAILSNLNAKELRELCPNGSCEISNPKTEITNSAPLFHHKRDKNQNANYDFYKPLHHKSNENQC